MVQQYKMQCCGRHYSYKGVKKRDNMLKCPYCFKKNPAVEEVDKEDETIFLGAFSGDKPFEKRPWGNFKVVLDEKNVKIKKIVVEPQGTLSLQLHKYRNEWWKIITGEGEVQIGNSVTQVKRGDSLVIDKFQVHRITNTGESNLVFVEVQTGICKEDDIIRIDDIYGRST